MFTLTIIIRLQAINVIGLTSSKKLQKVRSKTITCRVFIIIDIQAFWLAQ